MNMLHLEIAIVACLVSFATVLPGIFLVLRGMALMSDAISHAILPGIVIMFLIIKDLNSPLLLVGACCAGLLTVMITQLLIGTQRMKKDAAIGLVFPLFFSIGVILINRYAKDIHLDTDMVMLGEMAFAPFNRLYVGGIDCGPYAWWVLGITGALNALVIFLIYKELLLGTFDEITAHVLGKRPTLLFYLLMALTSLTTVAAFDTVGSIAVIALMITPVASAYMLAQSMSELISYSILLSLLASIQGYALATITNISIAGSITCLNGIFFLVALLFSPTRGLVIRSRKRTRLIKQIQLQNLTNSTTQRSA